MQCIHFEKFGHSVLVPDLSEGRPSSSLSWVGVRREVHGHGFLSPRESGPGEDICSSGEDIQSIQGLVNDLENYV